MRFSSWSYTQSGPPLSLLTKPVWYFPADLWPPGGWAVFVTAQGAEACGALGAPCSPASAGSPGMDCCVTSASLLIIKKKKHKTVRKPALQHLCAEKGHVVRKRIKYGPSTFLKSNLLFPQETMLSSDVGQKWACWSCQWQEGPWACLWLGWCVALDLRSEGTHSIFT